MLLNQLHESVTNKIKNLYAAKGHSVVKIHTSGENHIVQTNHPEGTFYHIATVNKNGINHRITKKSLSDARDWLNGLKKA